MRGATPWRLRSHNGVGGTNSDRRYEAAAAGVEIPSRFAGVQGVGGAAVALAGPPPALGIDMLKRWIHHPTMGLIQIRNVPEDVHRTLKVRAAAQGTSLSDYVLREMTRVARTPTPDEIDARIRARRGAGVTTDDILEARDAGRRT